MDPDELSSTGKKKAIYIKKMDMVDSVGVSRVYRAPGESSHQ